MQEIAQSTITERSLFPSNDIAADTLGNSEELIYGFFLPAIQETDIYEELITGTVEIGGFNPFSLNFADLEMEVSFAENHDLNPISSESVIYDFGAEETPEDEFSLDENLGEYYESIAQVAEVATVSPDNLLQTVETIRANPTLFLALTSAINDAMLFHAASCTLHGEGGIQSSLTSFSSTTSVSTAFVGSSQSIEFGHSHSSCKFCGSKKIKDHLCGDCRKHQHD